MTARADLYEALCVALSATEDPDGVPGHAAGPDVKVTVTADGSTPEPTLDLVVVTQDAIRPGTTAGDRLQRQLAVLVVGRLTTPGPDSDDALETLTGTVLGVLDELPWLLWTEATRAAYLDAYPCYRITLTMES